MTSVAALLKRASIVLFTGDKEGWKKLESQIKIPSERQITESRRKSRARRSRRRIWTGCILAVATVAAVMVMAVYYTRNYMDQPPVHESADILPDGNAVSGVLNAGDGQPVAKGDYWMILNQLPTIEAGSRDCNIQFENPIQNHFSSRLTLYLKSTGEQIGGTEIVGTGMYVETIPLSQILNPGEYPLQAVIELFDGSESAGEMSLEITLRVIQ